MDGWGCRQVLVVFVQTRKMRGMPRNIPIAEVCIMGSHCLLRDYVKVKGTGMEFSL